MATVYRMATDADIDALVRFWSDNAGWDEIDRAEWERRFYQTPFGPSAVALAADGSTGAILGQIIFIPTEVVVDGTAVQARRPYAVVLQKGMRSGLRYLGLMKLMVGMYTTAVRSFKAKGVGLIHMMPDPGWVRAFKFLTNAQTASFPLWSLPLPVTFALPPAYTVRSITPTDEQINPLWEQASRLYGCSFPRNTKTLPWKTSHGHYKLLGIFDNDRLVGISASLAKEKDRQWLICDVLSADADASLAAVLQATCLAAQDYVATNPSTIGKVALLATPLLQVAVEKLGFKPDAYRFPMVVQVLDKSLPKSKVAPERWYASAND